MFFLQILHVISVCVNNFYSSFVFILLSIPNLFVLLGLLIVILCLHVYLFHLGLYIYLFYLYHIYLFYQAYIIICFIRLTHLFVSLSLYVYLFPFRKNVINLRRPKHVPTVMLLQKGFYTSTEIGNFGDISGFNDEENEVKVNNMISRDKRRLWKQTGTIKHLNITHYRRWKCVAEMHFKILLRIVNRNIQSSPEENLLMFKIVQIMEFQLDQDFICACCLSYNYARDKCTVAHQNATCDMYWERILGLCAHPVALTSSN